MAETVGTIQVVATINTKDYDAGKKHIERGNQELETGAKKTSGGFSAAWMGAIAGVAASLTNTFMNAVKNSIGDAVKRVDTLNNSTRTFENMGIGAEDSSRAMKALQKSIKGLPTPLDSAVRGMTALTATYGDISKGQKVFSALNNAILGFGGTAAMVENAITQLSQLPLDGPLDAQTWNSLRNSGITPVLTAMAKDSGMSVAAMKEAFGKGELTVQDFIDKLLKLNTEGGGGLKSLEAIAKDSTAGISTGFANMQTALVRGVANVIEAIGSGGIASAFNTTSDVIDSASTRAVESISKIKDYINTQVVPAIKGMGEDIQAGDFNTLGKKIGEGIGGFVKFVTVNTQYIIDWFSEINWGEVGMAVGKVGVAFALGLITGLLSGEALSSALGFIKDNLGAVILAALTVVFAPSRLLGPIGKVLSKLPLAGLFTRIFITPIRNLFGPIREGFGTAFSTVFNVITSPFRRVGGVLGNLLSSIGKTITGFIETIGIRIAYLPETIVRVFTTVVGFIGRILGTMLNIIRTSLGFIGNIFSTVFNGAVTIIRTALTIGLNIIQTIISGIWTVITTILRPLTAFFVNLFRAAWSQVQVVFSGVGNFFRSIFTGAINIVRTIWNGITAFFSTVWNGIVQVFSVVGNFFRTIFNDALNGIRTIWNGVTGFFSSVWNGIVNIFNGVGGWFGNVFRSAFDGIKNIFNQLGGFFRGVWDNVTRIFGDAGTKVGNVIGNSFKSVVNTVISGAVNIINGFIRSINSVIGAINKLPGPDIGKIKELSVPQLANGGIVTAPTLAMIGEGRESEAVIPLSKLDDMLNNKGSSEDKPQIIQNFYPKDEIDMNIVNRKLMREFYIS